VTTDQVLSLLVHGPSKAGKSSLTFTGPYPLLVLDAEGSTKFITTKGFGSPEKVRKIKWNPLHETAPRADGTWDVCVVNVSDWQTMKMTKERLAIEPHDFASLSMDSVTEIQRKCKANMANMLKMQQQDWGVLLIEMDTLIRGFRDLLLLDNPLQVVTFVAETDLKEHKWIPNMQGGIRASLPYWVDICGYFYQEKDEAGVSHTQMLIENHIQYEAGNRLQGKLPGVILDPNINSILAASYA
jgi:hypothetical protein